VIEKGRLGSNWLASLAVERFGYHMPYNRLEQKYASEGLARSRTVLCRSTIKLAELFAPVHEALRVEIVHGDVAFADETSAKVQQSKACPTRSVWMWLYANGDGDCYFDSNESRGRDSPTRVLVGFVGWLHADGYGVEVQGARDRPDGLHPRRLAAPGGGRGSKDPYAARVASAPRRCGRGSAELRAPATRREAARVGRAAAASGQTAEPGPSVKAAGMP